MKKIKEMISLIVILLTLTGCVKMEVNMEIRKDKSMTLGIIQAANESLINQGTADLLDEEEKKEFQDAGYKIEDYKEKEMIGYKITKEIKNIDEVSTEEEITSDLGLNELKDNNYIFTIKKGLFKNTYKATLKNSDTEQINDSLNNDLPDNSNPDDILEDDSLTDEEITIDNDITIENEDETIDITEEDNSNNSLEDFDYSALMSGIEVSMKVKLPYKALSNNATTIENDGTTLTWDLMNFKEEEIKFEFEMYNTKNIIIISSIGLIIILLIIFLIIKKTKKKTITNNNNNLETNSNITQQQNTNPNLTQGPTQETQQPLNNNNQTNIISTPQEQVINSNQQLNNIQTNQVENQNTVQTLTNIPIQEQQPINITPQNNVPIFEPFQPNPVQPPIQTNSNTIFNQTEHLETPNISINQNAISQNQPINNINQTITTPVNNTINEQPIIQNQSIFEKVKSTNNVFENNISTTTPTQQVQNNTTQIPNQQINQNGPTENNNQQFNSNPIFTPQEQPQTNSVQQPINLEPLPNPMNLEQIGVSTEVQQQTEEQNIPAQQPSQYDSILSNNTDK